MQRLTLFKAAYIYCTALLLITALMISGCGSGSSSSPSPTLASIEISPPTTAVSIGLTVHFTATGTYSDGSTADISSQVTWASADTGIASIETLSGIAAGIGVGTTTITATSSSISSTPANLTVTTAVITGISISPTVVSTPKGTSVTFAATGNFSDGNSSDVSGSVTWLSSDTTVATLNSSGIASALLQGSTTISASFNGITSNNALLNVTDPALASLAISVASANFALGTTQQFIATGTLTDGTPATLGGLSWSSSDTAVATIDNTGLLTTHTPGSSNISASSGTITSNTVAITVFIPPAPAAAAGLFAVSATNQVTLSWSPASGATSYNLYWATAPGVSNASNRITGIASPYVHSGLTTATTYYYRVGAENAGGETLSNEVFSFVYSGTLPAISFVNTDSMLTARSDHRATLLANGTVLINGGADNGGNYLSSAEIYDPAATSGSKFSATDGMTTSRIYHNATLLANGVVLITGGADNASNYLASAELYDPNATAENKVSATDNMTTSRLFHTATLLTNNKVLVAGGFDGSNYLASSELYDSTASAGNKFSTTDTMSSVRIQHTATLLANSRVLIIGGQNITDILDSAEVYDPATGFFSSTGNLHTARKDHTATLLSNGTVLITGGQNATTGILDSAEIYDPATGLFSITGNMKTARKNHTATLLSNGNVLVIGGDNGNAIASAELYNPDDGTFSYTSSNMADARYNHSATLLSDGKVLVSGGIDTTQLSSAELFQ